MTFFGCVILMAGGFIGGFFGAAVGSAGLISLPILLFLGFTPHMAIGTTRPAAVILELICALRFRRDKILTDVLLKRGLILGIFGAIGSTAGAIISYWVSDQTLRLLLATIIALMMVFLFTKKKWGLEEYRSRQTHHVWIALGTLVTGLYAGLFGFTFGTVVSLLFVSFGYTLLQSAALSRVVGTIASFTAAIVFMWQGHVDYPYAGALGIGFLVGGWLGAKYAAKAGNGYIKTLLMAVILLSVFKLLFDYWTAMQ